MNQTRNNSGALFLTMARFTKAARAAPATIRLHMVAGIAPDGLYAAARSETVWPPSAEVSMVSHSLASSSARIAATVLASQAVLHTLH